MKKLALVLMILLLCAPAFALRVSVLEYDPFPAKAGSFLDLFISFENNQDKDTGALTAEFVPKDSLRLAFGENATKQVGIIPFRKSAVLKYRIEITDDALDGENTFRINVNEQGKTQTFYDLSIEVENNFPNIEIGHIESEPKKILPSTDDVKLTMTILNTGDEDAQNLKASIKLPPELEFSDSFSDTYLIGNLGENSSSQAVFFIDVPENTAGGSFKAQLVAEYTLKDAAKKDFVKKTIDFDIAVKPVPKFEITQAVTAPQTLSAGDRGASLKLTVKNVGDADAESVRIKVFQKSEQPFEFEKTFDFIAPTLKPGESGDATLEFRVKDDAALQKYLIDLQVKTFVDDTVITEDEVVELTVLNPLPSGPDPLILFGGALAVVIIVAIAFRRRIEKAIKNRGK